MKQTDDRPDRCVCDFVVDQSALVHLLTGGLFAGEGVPDDVVVDGFEFDPDQSRAIVRCEHPSFRPVSLGERIPRRRLNVDHGAIWIVREID